MLFHRRHGSVEMRNTYEHYSGTDLTNSTDVYPYCVTFGVYYIDLKVCTIYGCMHYVCKAGEKVMIQK